MEKMLKKPLAVILIVAMLICAAPFAAAAESHSGTCGTNLTWSFDNSTGALKISGTGAMTNWSSHSEVPWKYNSINYGIKSVSISSGVTSIGDYAFYDCTSLTSVTIPSSVKSIGSYAFRYCQTLKSITIPDSVTYIGDYAFLSCQSLTSIKIPSGVTAINAGTFYGCSELASVTIPYGVTTIGDEAFYGCWVLPSVKIPDSVVSIGDVAFQHCWALATITMPDKAMELGNDIFRKTAYQDNIKNWENGVLYVGKHLVSDGDLTVANNNSLSGEYTVKSGTKSIANVYFQNELTGLNIPATVGFIGENCFDNCENLKYIKVNSSNTTYSSDSANALYDKNKTTLIKYPAASSTTSYTLPGTVLTINAKAFENAKALKSVTLGSKVKTIGNYAFRNCTALTSVNVPASTVSIGDYAFYGCKVLSSISLGSNVETIGDLAFYNCDKIKSITLPEKLTKIGTKVFYSCDSLENVTIGNKVTEIGEQAFVYCKSLKNVTIPGSVKSIGVGAFAYCTAATSVVINPGVTSIDQVAFGAMTSLEYIHIPSSVTTIADNILTESTGYICSDSANNYAISFAKANGYSYKVCSGHNTATPDTPETKTYTLSYNANGGSGAPSSQSGAASYTISAVQPTRSGYTFLGWSKSSSATAASYKAGNTITLTANTTLYAVWQKNAVDPTPDDPTPDDPTPDDPTPDNPESTEIPEIEINRTSTTAINFGDILVLTIEEIEIPEGYAVAWFVEGTGVSTQVSADGTECRVTSTAGGTATVYAKLVDADGNVMTDGDGEEILDEITITSKAGFFQKLISFFKNLFAINRVIY